MVVLKEIRKHIFRFVWVIPALYILIRSAMVDITNDEAYSFHNMKEFWYAEFLCTGNSHWLNSMWMWMCIQLQLTHVFFLRLLSVGCSVLFLFRMQMFSQKQFDHTGICSIFLALILFNPYVLDYFVLARGYSQAMLFESLALMRMIEPESEKGKHQAIFFSCLSGLSQFSFLPFLISAIFIYFIKGKQLFNAIDEKKKALMVSVVLSTLLIVFFALRFLIRCSNDYVGAGAVSPNEATLSTFSSFVYSGSKIPSWLLISGGYLFLMIFVASVVIGVYEKENYYPFYINSLLLTCIIPFMVLSRFLFNGVFPSERSALFLFLPASLNICFLFWKIFDRWVFVPYLIYASVILLALNFIRSLNFSYTRDYRAQSQSEFVLTQLNSSATKVLLSGEVYGVFLNYYSLTGRTKYEGLRLENEKNLLGADHIVIHSSDRITTSDGKYYYIPRYLCKGVNTLMVLDLRRRVE